MWVCWKGKVGGGVSEGPPAIARFLGGAALGQCGYYGPRLDLTNHQCQFRPPLILAVLHLTLPELVNI